MTELQTSPLARWLRHMDDPARHPNPHPAWSHAGLLSYMSLLGLLDDDCRLTQIAHDLLAAIDAYDPHSNPDSPLKGKQVLKGL